MSYFYCQIQQDVYIEPAQKFMRTVRVQAVYLLMEKVQNFQINK